MNKKTNITIRLTENEYKEIKSKKGMISFNDYTKNILFSYNRLKDELKKTNNELEEYREVYLNSKYAQAKI